MLPQASRPRDQRTIFEYQCVQPIVSAGQPPIRSIQFKTIDNYFVKPIDNVFPDGVVRPELLPTSVDEPAAAPEPELTIVSTPKRKHQGKAYEGHREEVITHCLINGQRSTLSAFKHLGLPRSTLSDWMKAHSEGHLIGSSRCDKILDQQLDTELVKLLQDLVDSGQELHLMTVVTHAKALLTTNNRQDILGKYKITDSWASKWMKKHQFAVRAHTQSKSKKNNHPRNHQQVSFESHANDCR